MWFSPSTQKLSEQESPGLTKRHHCLEAKKINSSKCNLCLLVKTHMPALCILFKIPYNETWSNLPKDWLRGVRCPVNNLFAAALLTCFTLYEKGNLLQTTDNNNIELLFRVYHVLEPMLSTLHALCHLILAAILWDGYYESPHFRHKEARTHRD